MLSLFKKSKPPTPEITINEGDILVDKEYNGFWDTIQIYKIAESGKTCLYKFLVANGIHISRSNIAEADLAYINETYKKKEG